MTPIQYFLIYASIYLLAMLGLIKLIARSEALRTRDGLHEDTTPGTAVPLLMPRPAQSSPVDVDSPSVTLKLPPAYSDGDLLVTCKRVLLIERCPDPLMWYAGMIGKEVPYLGEWKAESLYKSREPAGYINVVKFNDARIIIKEST